MLDITNLMIFCVVFALKGQLTTEAMITIGCGPPPPGENAIVESFFTNPLDLATYRCKSGYKFVPRGSWVQRICTLEGEWELHTQDNSTDCVEEKTYIGCMELDLGLYEHVVTVFLNYEENLEQCLNHCILKRHIYAARRLGICYCLNSFQPLTAANETYCSSLCLPDLSSQCGGLPDYVSVHYLFGKCVAVTSMNSNNIPQGIKMYDVDHCLHLCKGRDAPLAFWRKKYMSSKIGKCYCLSEIPLLERRSDKDCQFYNVSTDFDLGPENIGRIYILEELPNMNFSSCEKLFHKGYYYNGNYYHLNGSKISCNFYDGSTQCDTDWIAFNGSCYYFIDNEDTVLSHHQRCKEKNSALVNIGSEEEMEFLVMAIKHMTFMKPGPIWTGLLDAFLTSNYAWSDETSFEYYRPFGPNNPIPFDDPHVHMDDGFLLNRHIKEMNAVCEKSKASFGCAKPTTTNFLVSMQPSLVSATMGLQECFETCRSEGMKFAATSNTKCFCLPDSQGLQKVDWSMCNVPCNAHTLQACGGGNTTHPYVFVIEVLNQIRLSGCTSSLLQGIQAPILDNDGAIVNCTAFAGKCPVTWLYINGSCYRFFTDKSGANNPVHICLSAESYLVSFETDHEKTQVMDTIRQTSLYSDQDHWLFGLVKPYRTGRYPSYINAAWYTDPSRYENVDGVGNYHIFTLSDNTTSVVQQFHYSFICERNNDFLGCYLKKPGLFPIIKSFADMNVRLCLEACKTTGKKFAGLHKALACICLNEDDLIKSDMGKCNLFCGFQSCGGTHFISVYAIDYSWNATSCTDLFEQGVTLSGLYVLDSGQQTYCGMYDSQYVAELERDCREKDPPCTTDITHYVIGGYNQSRTFALEVRGKTSTSNLNNKCSEPDIFSPSTVAAVYRDDNAKTLIQEMDRWSTKVVYLAGILTGLIDEFNMGIYTWSDGSLFRYSRHSYETNFFDFTIVNRPLFTQLKVGLAHAKKSVIYRYSCQREDFYLKCVNASETNLTQTDGVYIHGSMTHTMCQQICLANGSEAMYMSLTKCLCKNLDEPSTIPLLSSTICKQPCPGNRLQHCAEDGYFRVYSVAEDVAMDCQELRDNFVVKTKGILYKTVAGNTTCDQVDDDSVLCSPGFVATNGKCYRFQRRSDLDFQSAASACFALGAYPVVLQTEAETQAVMRLVTLFTHLKTAQLWLVGYHNPYMVNHVTSSLGQLVNNTVSDLDPDHRCVAYSVTSSSYVATDCSKPLPFICETSDSLSRCASLNDTSFAASVAIPGMTVQQCMAFCLGFGAKENITISVVALNGTKCFCIDESQGIILSNVTHLAQECTNPCPGQGNQACGSNEWGIFSLYNATLGLPDTKSCHEKFRHGIVIPSSYRTEQGDVMECFTASPQTDYIFESQPNATINTSSVETGHSSLDVSLQSLALNTRTWRASSEFTASVLVDLQILRVVEGIIHRDNLANVQQTMSVEHSIDQLTWQNFMTGNLSITTKNTTLQTLFPGPIVARFIRISLAVSQGKPDLAFDLMGYAYSNYKDDLLGCVHDNGISNSTPATTPAEMKEICASLETPFYTRSSCDDSHYDWGIYPLANASSCPSNDSVSAGGLMVPLYQTSDFFCKSVSVSGAGNLEVLSSMVNLTGVAYTIGTRVRIVCPDGYNIGEDKKKWNFTCLNFDMWTPSIKNLTCSRVRCQEPFPSFDNLNSSLVIDTVNQDFYYGDVITLTCQTHFTFKPGDSISMNVSCSSDGQWVFEDKNCVGHGCSESPVPVMSATAVVIDKDTARYQCVQNTTFSDGTSEKDVICNMTLAQWEHVGDSCTGDFRSLYLYLSHASTVITHPQPLSVDTTRSMYECVTLCTDLDDCHYISYSLHQQEDRLEHADNSSDSGLCHLYSNDLSGWTMQPHNNWNIFHIYK